MRNRLFDDTVVHCKPEAVQDDELSGEWLYVFSLNYYLEW